MEDSVCDPKEDSMPFRQVESSEQFGAKLYERTESRDGAHDRKFRTVSFPLNDT